MKFYNCTLLLNGDQRHEVFKRRISAAEVYMLRALHGFDAIRDIEFVAEKAVKDSQLRQYLRMRYEEISMHREGLVDRTFGPGSPLPLEVDLSELPEPSDVPETFEDFDDVLLDDTEVVAASKTTSKAGKSAAPAVDPLS